MIVRELCVWVTLQSLTLASPPSSVTIGALFTEADEDTGVTLAFKMAVDYVNRLPSLLPHTQLKYISNMTGSLLTTFQNIQSVCHQVEQNISILIGPATSTAVKAIYPITSGLHIPQIAPFATDPSLSVAAQEYPLLLKMCAPDSLQSEALVDLIRQYGWTRIAILASVSDYGRNGVQEFIRQASLEKWVLASLDYFYPVANASDIDLSAQLLAIKNSGARVVLLNCLAPYAKTILEQASRLQMTTKGWAWIVTDGVTSLDGLFNPCSEVPLHLRGLLGTRPAYGKGALYELFQTLWDNVTSSLTNKIPLEVGQSSNSSCNHDVSRSMCPPCEASQITPYTIRLFDSVLTAAYGLHMYFADGNNLTGPQIPLGACSNKAVTPWAEGELLFQYLQRVSEDGVMNYLNFTKKKYPWFTDYEVVNLRKKGWVMVNEWTPSEEERLSLPFSRVMFPGNTQDVPRDTSIDLKNVTLQIVTILEEPFVQELGPGERSRNLGMLYKGYCIDLIYELQRHLNFDFKIHLVGDGNYGGMEEAGWNGMVGEILDGEADVAVAPLTITYDRQQSVDFTAPFMDLGLTILMSREVPHKDSLAFLQPFDSTLWYGVFAAFVVCGICTTICSYLSPFGFHGRYTQRWNRERHRHLPDKNALNLYNGLWLTYASWMQQGTDRSPISFSGRLLHGVWWFTVMVLSATYTANLAAFLTVARLDTGIKSVGDLADQRQIHYGTAANSAPKEFFETQTINPYKKMYSFMTAEGTWVSNVSAGIEKVRESYGKPKAERYAFIFDSTILDHEADSPPCTTMTVGRLFSQIGYGVAFKKHSPYVRQFSSTILKLRSSGYLEALQDKWIKGSCPPVDESSTNTQGESATLESMSGVFFMLLIGIAFTMLGLMFEICLAAYRDTRRSKREQGENLAFCSAMGRRVKFISDDLKHTFCPCCNLSYKGDKAPGISNRGSVYAGKSDLNQERNSGTAPYADPISAYGPPQEVVGVGFTGVHNGDLTNRGFYNTQLHQNHDGVLNPVYDDS